VRALELFSSRISWIRSISCRTDHGIRTAGWSGHLTLPLCLRVELIAKNVGTQLTELDAISKVKTQEEEKKDKEHVVEAKELGLKGSLEPMDLEIYAHEIWESLDCWVPAHRDGRFDLGIDTPDSGSPCRVRRKGETVFPLESLKRGIALFLRPARRKELWET